MWYSFLPFLFLLPSALSLSTANNIQHVLDTAFGKDPLEPSVARRPPKVAVIGSGITGAIAAYTVHEGYRNSRTSFDDPLPEVTVFERNPIIGGRITQAWAYGDPRKPVDTCAQYFASSDTCIRSSLQSAGLRPLVFNVPSDVGTAAWNGTNFVGLIEDRGFRGPMRWSAFKTAKFFRRYGNLPWTFEQEGRDVLLQFVTALGTPESVPDTPVPSRPVRNFTAAFQPLLQAVTGGIAGNCDPQQDDLEACVRYANFVAEVLDPAVNERFFTGAFEPQVPPARLNALTVYKAYEDLTANVVVAGGNLRLIERLLKLSEATVRVGTDARGIRHSDVDGPQLTYRDIVSGNDTTETFDKIILAAPFQVANLTITPPLNDTTSDSLMNNPKGYLDTFVTHFTTQSSLNATVFDLSINPAQGNPQRILASAPFTNDPFFVSLRLVQPIERSRSPTGGPPVMRENLFRLVTRSAPDTSLLQTWLNDGPTGNEAEITWMDVQSLPLSTPMGYGAAPLLEDIEIAPGVVHAGAGEQILGNAEIGCKMGLNAANLVLQQLLEDAEGDDK